ncbi:oxysterol-binding protein-related protein 3 isoform X1 [Electrophorus electricus]|uniref:oxysterol-binding protein-related protein 3 isoform X1 n=1 Tax=Electrophorus electricus TaxID=8005 RepID=UPI0015CFCE83|nr:oxysterol-binding protein-related protein 3 isoform X1 [Electrophorus electricus]XP_035386518.1 oxysterol-binding protein-related protein 3 isoform X1 [Electrophorus electricus]XP_035386519.1 oxysterol-binding protein-related protein 3 isoform X1 [Electrophorus electricus]XP_035386520.1 oxysterol-binding protein-related protein 3 isoform X1 [Electrophorus electricus]
MSQKISSPSRSNSSSSSKHDSRQDSWEIVEGLRGCGGNIQDPERQEGYMLKKRKWPMKGWHKRYFILDKGILKYAKSSTDIEKGKLHGCIDVGLSVMAIKNKTKCIDLDAEENIYHLKIKSQELFDEWVSKLRHHRLYRQNEISMFPQEKALFSPHCSPSSPVIFAESQTSRKHASLSLMKQSSLHSPNSFPIQAKVAAWLQSSDDFDKCSKELSECETQLLELNHLLRSMEVLHRTCSAPAINALQASTFDSPKKEKRLIRKWRPKNYGKDSKATLQVPSCISSGSFRLHASNPNLSSQDLAIEKSYPEVLDIPIDVSKLQEDFCRVANNLHSSMKSALGSLTAEKDRLRQMLEQETSSASSTQIVGLKSALASALAQNSDLRERLCKIHTESHISEATVFKNVSTGPLQESVDCARSLVHQTSDDSQTSITESMSEFFDAQEVLVSASSSENEPSDDESYISDVSDDASVDNFNNEVQNQRVCSGGHFTGLVKNGAPQGRRRATLPSPCPSASTISLWNILKNNIGKDLSKVAMPVQLNEPLNTLQRLCEELEYSELLDRAALTQDPFERMVYIATFAVSGYAASYYRAGGKPFNPLLGETYECERPEKGFRFIAEQVSHHPPISACHADSKNFIFWQDMRWKNKFWGKSMEIVPVGTTHVVLPGLGDHYEWNKVTSCIHNIMSGQRWIEHYGELSIKNAKSNICQCKVTFKQAKYWNSSVNEVDGSVLDQKGKVIHKLFGKWHESIYWGNPPTATCVWRANPMPPEHEQYYGFTKFALELNELDAQTKPLLPPTDTRLRLDQRLLEEGNVEEAEIQKQRIEQMQRDRRKVLEENDMEHEPRFFQKSTDDTWISNNTYWDLRKEPGFSNLDFPVLW